MLRSRSFYAWCIALVTQKESSANVQPLTVMSGCFAALLEMTQHVYNNVGLCPGGKCSIYLQPLKFKLRQPHIKRRNNCLPQQVWTKVQRQLKCWAWLTFRMLSAACPLSERGNSHCFFPFFAMVVLKTCWMDFAMHDLIILILGACRLTECSSVTKHLFCFGLEAFRSLVTDFENNSLTSYGGVAPYWVKQAVIIFDVIRGPTMAHVVTPCGCTLDGGGWMERP